MYSLKITILLLSLTIFANTAHTQVNVGIKTLHFLDSERKAWNGKNQRPITTTIFYPTLDENIQKIMIGEPNEELFYAGNAVWNATITDQRKRPLIIMSHGTGGAALQMLWIAEELVKNGYIVAGINHHGNTTAEQKQYAPGYILWWERTQDIGVVLNKLISNTDWASHINESKIGALGFSLGGYTVLSALGGITDKSLFYDFCDSDKRDSTCDDQVEFPNVIEEFKKVQNTPQVIASVKKEHDLFRIKLIKAGFIIAPAVIQAFTEDSLKEIQIPTYITGGTLDKVAPIKTNASYAASIIPNNHYLQIQNAGHYTFLSECTNFGKKVLTGLCYDTPNADRNEIHKNVSKEALNFFDAQLLP